MKIRQSLAGLCLVALLSACGGGGSDDPGQGTVGTQPSVPTNQLVPLARYTGPASSFQKVNLTMPVRGILDFSLQGTNVRIFDPAMNLVGQGNEQTTIYQENLAAGAYVVEFQYWSANSRNAVAYSPALLAFGDLPQLRNAIYSASENSTTYHRASFATTSRIDFAGSGTAITIFDSNMNLVKTKGDLYSPETLPAGDYIFKFKFWSSNSKSISITSPGLP